MTNSRITIAFVLLVSGLAVAQPVRTSPAGAGSGSGGPSFTPTTPGKLPEGASRRLGSDLFREPNYISAASISPDGKTLAVCGGSQIIRFLDIATGKELRRITVREYLRTNQILWMPDGKQIVTTGYNGINVWDTSDGKLIKQATNPNKDGRDGMIHMSADGKFVAVGAIEPQFYGGGLDGWVVKYEAEPNGGVAFDSKFFVDWRKGHRPHQVRLQGGDCSSDSYCYP